LTKVTLTFDPMTQKSIGWMCGPSLNKVGQRVLEFLIGNEKVTDGQTDRQTDRQTYMCKAICTLIFEGGHNN